MPTASAINFAPPVEADRACYAPEDVFAAGELNHHISNTAYPIAHSQTFKPYRIERSLHRETTERAFTDTPDICLYSHIPFCETRCFFCEYTVVGKSELERTREYMTALNRETEMYAGLFGPRTLHGWDIGGGTPSFPAAEFIAEHIDVVKQNFALGPGFAISIETTPRIASLEPDKIHAYRQMGIERISMGVQVTQPDLLKALGRDTNGLEHHYRAAGHIRAAGFEKFNLDLMYGFADQSLESWHATLEHAIALAPDYITLYRMRYKLTRISHQAGRVTLDMAREHAKLAKQILTAAGFRANPGKNTYSRIQRETGTSAYLTRRVITGQPYLGLGLGAQTYSPTTIAYNSGAAGKNLSPYLRDIDKGVLPIQDLYALPHAHMMAKMIAVSFYFGEINLAAFKERFGLTLEEAYPAAVEFALQQGLMHYTQSENGTEIPLTGGACLSLTEEGAKHFNGTIALFFAPSVQAYLLARNQIEANAAI